MQNNIMFLTENSVPCSVPSQCLRQQWLIIIWNPTNKHEIRIQIKKSVVEDDILLTMVPLAHSSYFYPKSML